VGDLVLFSGAPTSTTGGTTGGHFVNLDKNCDMMIVGQTLTMCTSVDIISIHVVFVAVAMRCRPSV
jgi:hypothetical protein